MDDDDEIPSLIDVDEAKDLALQAEEKLTTVDTTGLKVPITIVTGRFTKRVGMETPLRI